MKATERIKKLEDRMGFMGHIIDGAVQRYGPVELIDKILDKIFTPENLRAISEGAAKGFAESMKNK